MTVVGDLDSELEIHATRIRFERLSLAVSLCVFVCVCETLWNGTAREKALQK